jgi:hypothetical protein
LLRQRTLSLRDLTETRRGACRILPPLAKHLTTTTSTWRRYVGPVAERVARTIGESASAGVDIPRNLTGANRRAAWLGRGSQKTTVAPLAPLPPTCRNCGGKVPYSSRRYCEQCRRASAAQAGQTGRGAAHAALARLREEGRDPGHVEKPPVGEDGRTPSTKAVSPPGGPRPALRTRQKSSADAYCPRCANGRSLSLSPLRGCPITIAR